MIKSVSVGFSIVILCVLFITNAAGGEPLLDKNKFNAAGYNETLLHIDTPGRYSIQAHSKQGTRLELVDRMAGPMFSAGTIGEQDGRLDVLLDEGTYKIRLRSHKKGEGELELAVYPFQEVQPVEQPEDLPLLENLRFESGTLGDLQQRSFWIYLKKRQVLRLEAIGRNLKDCRLWLDGEWLVDVSPDISEYETISGQPMMYAEFFHDLNPGLYLLTCYGGEALAWANESKENPFYLRMGIPEFGTNGQKIVEISPFGRETFVVSGETNFFELSRKDKKNTALHVGSWDPQGSRYDQVYEAIINKESRDPWCSLRVGDLGERQTVTVQGTPGDLVVLKYFVIRNQYEFPRSTPNEYWIENQYSSEAIDAIDATAVLAPILRHSPRVRVEKSQVIEVGNNSPLVRKVNLLGELFVFLKILDDGTYIIEEDPTTGAKGRYKIEPLLFSKPKDYRSPPYMFPGNDIPLSKGFAVLSVQPEFKGILSFVLRKKDVSLANVSSLIPFPNTTTSPTVAQLVPISIISPEEMIRRQRLLWPNVRLETSDRYVLISNHRPEVVSGFIIRSLPLDLSDPLPVMLSPGEQVPINLKIQKTSKLMIENDQNASFEISGYVEPIASDSILSPGKYTLALKNTSQQATLFIVKTVLAEMAPALTKNELMRKIRGTAQFPILTERDPLYRNFDRKEKQHFTLLVEEPGLYRLETSGRLATRITVRNRFTTSLFSTEQNGIGRNALVQQYIKPGEYQITVQTLGKSKGRAGIHLRRAPLIEEDDLRVGIQKKIHLVPDEAVRYRYEIDQTGKYRLRTLGLNKAFIWRLEDREGWPFLRPNQKGAIKLTVTRSSSGYYTSLPEAVESRRITVLEEIEDETPFLEGKGPHRLVFNTEIEHVWREEPDRPPDVFVLDVPDPVRATVYLGEDMEAGIYKCEPNNTPLRPPQGGNNTQEGKNTPLRPPQGGNCVEEIGWVQGGKSRTFEQLLSGRYEIRAKSVEENDRLPYTLRVKTNQLITGLRYTVDDLPTSFVVSTGDDSLVELFSFGTIDVKATLWQGGRLVAQNDDMENDWNFRISHKLNAGTYRLKLEPVGASDQGFLEVGMTKRNDRTLSEQEFPFTAETELVKEVVSIPFITSPEGSLTHIRTTGPGVVKLALFRENRMLAEGIQELFIPLRPTTRYMLLVWRPDEFAGEITVDAQALPIREVSLSSPQTILQAVPLTEEIRPQVAKDIGLTAFKLTHAEKVSYTLKGELSSLFFAPEVETPFAQVEDVPVVMGNHSGWLLWKVSTSRKPQESPSIGIVTTQRDPLNIRIRPGKQYSVIEKAPKGETLVIKGMIGEWYEVQLQDGTLGYAYHKYITPHLEQPDDKQDKVVITPFSLGEEQSAPVKLGQTPLPFDFEQKADVPMLLEIKSIGATLGAMIYQDGLHLPGGVHLTSETGIIASQQKDGRHLEGEAHLDIVNWLGMWMAPSRTFIAIPGQGTYRGCVWATSDEPVKGKVLLNHRSFTQTKRLNLTENRHQEGEIQPDEAYTFPLDETLQFLDLLLTKGLVAFAWHNGQTEAFAAAVEENLQQRISVSGGELILLNTGSQTGIYRIEKNDVAAQAAPDVVQPFDPASGFEQVFTSAGKLVLKIPDGDEEVFVAGDQVRSRFLRMDGRLTEGHGTVSFDPTGSGLLELFYEPGYVRVWQSKPEEKKQRFMGALPDIEAESFQDGLGTLEDQSQLWKFSLTSPQYIIAETESPGITAILGQNRVLATSVGSSSNGRQLMYFLQPGEYQMWTRPLKGLVQQGRLRLQKITPQLLDSDAASKTWLIHSGEIQVFRFQVTTKATVGVGVQTESDRLQARLFDGQSTLLATGPLVFQELEVGEYLFTVRTSRSSSSPVQYRPVVFGHHGSLQGIPADVMKQYQRLNQ